MLVLPTELNHEPASACSRMLAQAVRSDSGKTAVVDASALARFDSSALAVLLECRREALACGKSFSVRQLPQRLRELPSI